MLEVKDLAVNYGPHRALEGVNVAVAPGEICVILGANGAGKSTLLKAIAGMVGTRPGGEIVMNGRPITRMKPHRIVEEGIALVPEGRGIFGDLTVAENLQLGAFAARARRDEKRTLAQIYELFPRLAERKSQTARTMSGGEQQMVAIGRALMSKPEILMLDEPSLGLSPLLSQELFRALSNVASGGVGILLVEQNARQSLKIAERGYLIENGHVTGEASARALMNDPAVVNAYLGGAAKHEAEPRPKIVLPPSIGLPATVQAIGRAIGDLATRAGRIQQAFIRARRREHGMPSAFVGRYDPKAGGDPWAELAAGSSPAEAPRVSVVSTDARRLGRMAASLSASAGERLSEHVRLARLNAPVPSAFARRLTVEAEPYRPPAARGPDPGLNGSHGLIGHNSAGLVEEGAEAAEPATQQPALIARPQSIQDLVARAAAIHAGHVEARRKTLSVFTVPAKADAAPRKDANDDEPADRKRKKHKEA